MVVCPADVVVALKMVVAVLTVAFTVVVVFAVVVVPIVVVGTVVVLVVVVVVARVVVGIAPGVEQILFKQYPLIHSGLEEQSLPSDFRRVAGGSVDFVPRPSFITQTTSKVVESVQRVNFVFESESVRTVL